MSEKDRERVELLQGTLDLIVLRSLSTMEQKGWIKGTWQKTANNRDAKYYAITKSGVRALGDQTERWRRLSGLVNKLLANES
jgi:PadR family transcriptional regulator PadR